MVLFYSISFQLFTSNRAIIFPMQKSLFEMREMTYQVCVHFVLQIPANFDPSLASYTCCESEQLL
jgi:hypothetical protein